MIDSSLLDIYVDTTRKVFKRIIKYDKVNL